METSYEDLPLELREQILIILANTADIKSVNILLEIDILLQEYLSVERNLLRVNSKIETDEIFGRFFPNFDSMYENAPDPIPNFLDNFYNSLADRYNLILNTKYKIVHDEKFTCQKIETISFIDRDDDDVLHDYLTNVTIENIYNDKKMFKTEVFLSGATVMKTENNIKSHTVGEDYNKLITLYGEFIYPFEDYDRVMGFLNGKFY